MRTRPQTSELAPSNQRGPVLAVLENADCSLCGSRDFDLVYAATLTPDELHPAQTHKISYHRPRQHLQVVRCRQCQLVQVNPRLLDEQNLSHYEEMSDDGYLSEQESRLAMGRRVVRKIAHWMPPGRMLDLGCAAGYQLQAARELGWEVEGIEPSRWAIDHARRKYGITVHHGPVEAMGWPAERFDAIVMSDVIEHLHDPRRTLQELHRLLKPGGVLYLTTPRFECLWSKILRDGWWGVIPAHNFYFTARTLQELLDSTGFRTMTMTTASRTFTFQYWLEQGEAYAPLLARLGKAVASRLGLLQWSLSLNLRDQLETVASKLS